MRKKNATDRISVPVALEILQLELRSTLEATQLCHVRQMQSRGSSLRVVFSVPDQHLPRWHELLTAVLPRLQRGSIGRLYAVHDGALVAPWVLDVAADDTAQLHEAVLAVRIAFMRLANAVASTGQSESARRA